MYNYIFCEINYNDELLVVDHLDAKLLAELPRIGAEIPGVELKEFEAGEILFSCVTDDC